MPFDSEGIFSRLHNWEDDRVNDIDIVTDHMDEEDNNFADGLSQCFLKNGISKMEGNLNVGNFKVVNIADGTLPNDAVNRGQLDNTTQIAKEFTNLLINVGDIKASVISQNHNNWILCNGQELLRNEYTELFEIIGEKFGIGNGVTTFNVPNYQGKFLRGFGENSAKDIYTMQKEGLPNITGFMSTWSSNVNDGANNSALFGTTDTSGSRRDSEYIAKGCSGINFDASRSNSIYGSSEHVTPENYAVYWFIKAKREE